MDMLRTIVAALKGTHTRVLAAAVERAQDLTAAAVIGADIATITPDAAFAALEKPYPITECDLRRQDRQVERSGHRQPEQGPDLARHPDRKSVV